MMMQEKLHMKQKKRTSPSVLFRNESGAIDLASIMVGVIVIGVIGGVIATTVFAVIPWTQDKAAQQQMDSVVAAQSAYVGLSSSVPPAVPAGHPTNSYASSAQLEEAGLLKRGGKHCTISADAGKGYTAFTRSDSGKIWTASDKKTSPEIFNGTLPADCQFLAEGATGPTGSDIDGDGIPNESDRDADGDGVQDGYVPGGPIAVLDGTSAPTSGIYYSTRITDAGTTITSNASNTSATSSRKISMHFLVTCVKDDGSFYKKNFLNGYTATTTSYNSNFTTVACASGERIDEYTVKPVTQEALTSGELSNPEFFGGWTFSFNGSPGGVRWSEPDGYPTFAEFYSSQLTAGNTNIFAYFLHDSASATRQIVTQLNAECIKADKSTYKVTKLAGFNSVANIRSYVGLNLTPCGTDRITAYTFSPLTQLGKVDNRSLFSSGYTTRGGKSWTEADGYPATAEFYSSFLTGGGSTLNMTFLWDDASAARAISAQFELTCEKADRTTYKVNRLTTFSSTANIRNYATVSTTNCGADRIIAYTVAPVTNIAAVQNPENFTGGFTVRGSKSWSEDDGYPTNGSFYSAYLGNGGSTVYATYLNGSTNATTLTTQYILTCERPDKTTYAVNRMAAYSTRTGYIEYTTLLLTGCGTDLITGYEIFPVNKLGDAENRSVFGGYGISGGKKWVEADGYRTNGSFYSAYLGNGGSTVYATYLNGSSTSTALSSQYVLTCERSDSTTYTVNRIATYTSRTGYVEYTTLSLTGCGTDLITAYEIFPVNKLSDAENRSAFAGTTLTGSKSWIESRDGYRTSGSFYSASLSNGGTTVSAIFLNSSTTSTSLATQYILTCKRSDNTTYTVNRIAAYSSRPGYIEYTTLSLTGCGTDLVSAYEIFPVKNLGDAENRSAFSGTTMTGGKSWTG